MNQNSLETKITESPEVLLELLSQQTYRWNYLQVEALYLLKSGMATTFRQVATLLEVHQDTPGKWFQKYEEGGLTALLSKPHIPLSVIPDWADQRLLEELQKATFLPTALIVQAWLRTIGFKVSNDTASLLISMLKPRLQVLPTQASGQSTKAEHSHQTDPIRLASDVYPCYQEWKEQHQISSDAEALCQIMSEYFQFNQSSFGGTASALKELSNSVTGFAVDTVRQQDVPAFLHQEGLAKRLAVSSSLLCRNRSKPTFTRWSQQRDPDGLSWKWLPSLRKYQTLT